MEVELHPVEARVLGSLIEKEITTPEYYPLSLNALINACNQKSKRDPVVFYNEDTVVEALETLRTKGFSSVITGAGSRVPKYAHRFSEQLNLGRREIAILCELMLRGPQTGGELRNRGERLHRFNDLTEVEGLLEKMTDYIVRLPKRSGEKEARYSHVFCGPVVAAEYEAVVTEQANARSDRVSALEVECSQLRAEVDELKRQFAEFRKQFE